MLLKCYHHLYHVVDCDVESTQHKSYEDNGLDIFEMITNTHEPFIKLVTKKLSIFRRSSDFKEIKCPF